jgi:hypothetical protein
MMLVMMTIGGRFVGLGGGSTLGRPGRLGARRIEAPNADDRFGVG